MKTPEESAVTQGISDIFRRQAHSADTLYREDLQSRLRQAQKVLRDEPGNLDARLAKVHWLRKLGCHRDALVVLKEAYSPGCAPRLTRRYIALLEECNRTEEAIALAAAEKSPHDILLRLKEALLLPVLYDSTAAIERWRNRFAGGLERIVHEVTLDTHEQCLRALRGIAGHTNVYLAYQGLNDRDLQKLYGHFVHRIMSACYPQFSLPFRVHSPRMGEPLRIGFVSARLRDLSATRFFSGWIRERNRTRVFAHTWYVRTNSDAVTEEVRRTSDVFYHLAADSETSAGSDAVRQIAASIRSANLHGLIFLDIGMVPLMTQLAALRLAPVQCMAWDHPVTSGLPTIDYALSGDLSEPAEADATSHYTERLLRLPGVGVCYRKPLIPLPLLLKKRTEFGLREDDVVFLCCQSVFKFLPENDHVYPEIAHRVPGAQFAFIITNELVGSDFNQRIQLAFSAAGLDANRHCVFLPQLQHLDYWNLNRLGDVFLDTIGWSSAGSVYDAIACRVPVVCLPGRLMRTRQSAAMMTQAGVTETIAKNKAEFVAIAAKLGLDKEYRNQIVAKLAVAESALFSDTRSVDSLETFFARQAGAE